MAPAAHERRLSGVFIRHQIGSKWVTMDVTDLPWTDVVAWLERTNADREFVLNFAGILHKRIQEMGEAFDAVRGDELVAPAAHGNRA